jgi:hypothetical protein
LVFDSHSDIQFALDDTDNDFTHNLSEDSDGIVKADEEWHERRGEDKATMNHFTSPDPGLIHVVVGPDINGDSSSFDFFRLMLTEEQFSTILTETNHYYQQHTQKEENRTLQMDIAVNETYNFIPLKILMGLDQHDTIKDYWSANKLYYTLFCSNFMKRDRFLHIMRHLHFENNKNLTEQPRLLHAVENLRNFKLSEY